MFHVKPPAINSINTNTYKVVKNSLWLRNICLKNHYNISEDRLKILEKFVEQLSAWNNKINLISRRDVENIWSQHILASISFLFKFQFQNNSKILDIGTGGGLPGVPLSILNPSCKFVLVDSIKKKIDAVKDIIGRLDLKNVFVECGRAEDLSKDIKYKCSFDHTISRAVASMVDVTKWSKPFLKNVSDEILDIVKSKKQIPRGTALLFKGGEQKDEIKNTQIKIKPKFIQSYSLIIDGIETTELFDKKIIIIKP